jgi:hypothetical protein
MKNLLYKEFKLAAHPTIYFFLALDAMLLIPSYPYYVAFIYTCLAVFFLFLSGRENKDIFYTVSLPIRKKDAVKARCWMIAIIEVAQILVAVPFAILGVRINPNPQGNLAGIEANVAFFGFVFLMFSLYNILFIPMFYQTAYRAGKCLAVAGTAVAVYIVAIEVAVQEIQPLKINLDTTRPDRMIRQIPILAVGIAVFALTMVFSYRKAAKNFEKVDL